MQSIDFYTLPSTNYNGITFDGAYIWAENLEEMETNDSLYVPNEFYDKPDKDGITATDFIYGRSNDLNTYIMRIICTKQHMNYPSHAVQWLLWKWFLTVVTVTHF